MLANRVFALALGLAVFGSVVSGFPSRPARAQEASSTLDGIYTDGQAQRGGDVYQANCASCHGKTLEGSGQTPALTGDDFTANWVNQTMADLFDKTNMTMPADHPGKLTREQTADVLAFVLSSNKFPSGKAELPTAEESLKKIRIAAPPPQS
jgi:S-disulfanyl-L-cysteine oxidoreductase SoxD